MADTVNGSDELAQLDARIVSLQHEVVRAQQALSIVQAALQAAVVERGALLARLSAPPPAAPPGSVHVDQPVVPAPPGARETSTRTVQNLLFVLGGLLLGTAAIVFTAVAWATFGVAGRAAILGVVTVLALAAPLVAIARRLRATAETFVSIGLLLVLLDGYAAWYVDLAGVQAMDGRRYAGVVAALTVLIALAYATFARLAAPVFVALVVGQPIVTLLVAPAHPGATAGSLLASGMAVVDALVAAAASRRGRFVLAGLAWAAFLGWVFLAFALAQWAMFSAVPHVRPTAAAAAATVLVSLVLLLGAWLTGSRGARNVAAGIVVAMVDYAVSFTALMAWPDRKTLVYALAALGVGVAVRLIAPATPEWLRTGPRVAAVAVAALSLLVLLPLPVLAVAGTIARAYPFWSARLAGTRFDPALFGADLPVALLALALAIALNGPRWMRRAAPVAGGGLAVLALPACTSLPWWSPPALDLVGAALLATAFLVWRVRAAAVGAAVLVAAAALSGNARPVQSALTLAGVLVLGLVVGLLARHTRIGETALAVGLSALPPAVGSALVTFDVAPWWSARAAVASVALLLAVAALSRRAGAGVAVLVAAVVWPLALAHVGDESLGVYSGLSLLLLAGALAVVRPTHFARTGVAVAAVLPGVVYLVAELPAVLAVSVSPYGWLGSVWSGAPAGVGIAPAGLRPPTVRAVDAVALAGLALACGLAGYALRRRLRAFLTGLGVGGPTAVLAALVAAHAPWPAMPATTLLLGLGLAFVAALTSSGPWRTTLLSGQSIVYIGAGIAGALGVQWSTLAALGAVVVAGAVIGGIGRTVAWRVAGCVGAVAAAVAEASAAGAAADLPLRMIAFWVLVPAILAILGGALLARDPRRRTEGVAIQAAGNGAALLAVTFTAGWAVWAAGVVALWGLAIGVRALVPGATRAGRARLAAVAAGLELIAWWLLLADRAVSTVEFYTLPLSAVALFAGWAALRSRPELRSWVAYGPALLAGFLPSLAPVLVSTGEVWRRLALFVAAVVVVVLGAAHRRQAPVVVGGVVALVVALHELVLLWQLLPGWIPLAAGGGVLLFLAITYERRRRDVSRMRGAIGRMT